MLGFIEKNIFIPFSTGSAEKREAYVHAMLRLHKMLYDNSINMEARKSEAIQRIGDYFEIAAASADMDPDEQAKSFIKSLIEHGLLEPKLDTEDREEHVCMTQAGDDMAKLLKKLIGEAPVTTKGRFKAIYATLTSSENMDSPYESMLSPAYEQMMEFMGELKTMGTRIKDELDTMLSDAGDKLTMRDISDMLNAYFNDPRFNMVISMYKDHDHSSYKGRIQARLEVLRKGSMIEKMAEEAMRTDRDIHSKEEAEERVEQKLRDIEQSLDDVEGAVAKTMRDTKKYIDTAMRKYERLGLNDGSLLSKIKDLLTDMLSEDGVLSSEDIQNIPNSYSHRMFSIDKVLEYKADITDPPKKEKISCSVPEEEFDNIFKAIEQENPYSRENVDKEVSRLLEERGELSHLSLREGDDMMLIAMAHAYKDENMSYTFTRGEGMADVPNGRCTEFKIERLKQESQQMH